MKIFLFQFSIILLLLGLPQSGYATNRQYIPVYCNTGQSLQDAIDKATEGAAVDVWGTCAEAVVIRTDGIRIGAFAGQTAILSPPAASAAITVLGARNVSVFGLNIQGGSHGIIIHHGGGAVITDNQISDSAADGIAVTGNSYAHIEINVLNKAISIFGGSSASVLNNTIVASTGPGISVSGASNAEMCGNEISNTNLPGIIVGTNSNIVFAPACGANIVSNAQGEAFRCQPSGSVSVLTDQVFDGAVIQEPDCHIERAPGVTIP